MRPPLFLVLVEMELGLCLKVTESHGSSLLAIARCTCTSRPFAEEPLCQRLAQDQADALQHVERPAGAGSA